MESTSERNRRTVEELILSRIDSLVEAKLISKERLEACKQKIVGSVDASTKQSTVGILTVGLIYALLSNQRHNSNAKETDALLFNPKRTLADVLHLFEDFWKITGSKRHEVLRDLFLEVYNSRERNPTYLGLIKEVFDKILSDLAIKDEFSKIISEFDQSADYPKPKMEIDQKTTETLLAALEKVFFSFSEENPSPRVIPWEETLVERARKTHYFPERHGGGMTGVEESDSGNPEDGTRSLPEIKSKPKKTPAIVAQELKKQPPSPDTVPRSIILDSKSGPQKEAPTVAIAIQETNPWDRVGKILVREEKEGFTGIGIIDTPLINTKGKIFLAAAIENDLEIDQIDSLFREVQNLRIEGISDTTAARRDSLRETIAEFLGVPLNLGLSPSLVREYLARRDLRFEAVFKQSVVRREYYPSEKVVTIPEHDEWLVIAEEVKGRIHLTDSLPYSPPFRSRNGKIQGAKIAVWTDELIGQAVSQFSLGNISQLLMEFDFPSEAFLGQLIPKIRGFNPQNMEKLWYLRFFVAKKLESYSVFEGEALLFWNLWRFIWTQKIPILPFDLRASFFGVLYSG
ncbi:MAG TPA: hypothetical protein VJ044_10985, partial [Candidatus Hodarchaeales archaeon]|nr:hypothetical protein [Candidatus Hodarchaeales archaeon]